MAYSAVAKQNIEHKMQSKPTAKKIIGSSKVLDGLCAAKDLTRKRVFLVGNLDASCEAKTLTDFIIILLLWELKLSRVFLPSKNLFKSEMNGIVPSV